MRSARALLQEATVVATTPVSAPSAANSANPRALPGGTAPVDSSSDSSSSSPFYVNSHFSPTMIIVLVILLSAFFFMGLFAVYVRRCASEEEDFSRRGSSHRRQTRRDALTAGSGVDPLLVESYPMVSYAAAKKKGCHECPVCLAEFEGGEELKQLPKCKHVFHPGCVGLWLESHTTCPLCRRSLVNSDRWGSISFRWGGSSRGGSLSAQRNGGSSQGGSLSARRNGEGSSRSRIGRETASSRLGRAESSTGLYGRNEDASSRGGTQPETSLHDTSLRTFDSSPLHELESQGLPTSPVSSSQHGLPTSARLPEVAPRGSPARSPVSSELVPRGLSEAALSNLLPQGMQLNSSSSDLMPREIQECCVSADLMPRGYQLSEVAARGLHETELAKSALAQNWKPRQTAAVQGRKKTSRSNSTGHSARRRAALQATGCVPFLLHRSRSVGVYGVDEEEARAGAACATAEHGPLSGSSCGSQSPHEP